MPAHELRKQVLCRMWRDEQLRLDALGVVMSGAGKRLGRSAVINRLVEEAYGRLPGHIRESATAAARRKMGAQGRAPETSAADAGG